MPGLLQTVSGSTLSNSFLSRGKLDLKDEMQRFGSMTMRDPSIFKCVGWSIQNWKASKVCSYFLTKYVQASDKENSVAPNLSFPLKREGLWYLLRHSIKKGGRHHRLTGVWQQETFNILRSALVVTVCMGDLTDDTQVNADWEICFLWVNKSFCSCEGGSNLRAVTAEDISSIPNNFDWRHLTLTFTAVN